MDKSVTIVVLVISLEIALMTSVIKVNLLFYLQSYFSVSYWDPHIYKWENERFEVDFSDKANMLICK